MSYSGQLIRIVDGVRDAEPEFAGAQVTLDVGIPSGRLRATYMATTLYLRLYTDETFEPDVIASTPEEVQEGRRSAMVPGDEPGHGRVDWQLCLDGSTPDEFEAFLKELRDQGCGIQRPPSSP